MFDIEWDDICMKLEYWILKKIVDYVSYKVHSATRLTIRHDSLHANLVWIILKAQLNDDSNECSETNTIDLLTVSEAILAGGGKHGLNYSEWIKVKRIQHVKQALKAKLSWLNANYAEHWICFKRFRRICWREENMLQCRTSRAPHGTLPKSI